MSAPAATTERFVTVTYGLRGYFAVLMWWNPDGFWEPWQSGIGSYVTAEDAAKEGREWAEAEGVKFKQ